MTLNYFPSQIHKSYSETQRWTTSNTSLCLRGSGKDQKDQIFYNALNPTRSRTCNLLGISGATAPVGSVSMHVHALWSWRVCYLFIFYFLFFPRGVFFLFFFFSLYVCVCVGGDQFTGIVTVYILLDISQTADDQI